MPTAFQPRRMEFSKQLSRFTFNEFFVSPPMIRHVLYFDVRNRGDFVRISSPLMGVLKGDSCLRIRKVNICVTFFVAARLARRKNGTRFASTMKSQGLTWRDDRVIESLNSVGYSGFRYLVPTLNYSVGHIRFISRLADNVENKVELRVDYGDGGHYCSLQKLETRH